MKAFFQQVFFERNPIYSVILEDDGRVGYAYLLEGEEIVADVWLYNQAPTPINTDGNTEMPFLNPTKYSLGKRCKSLADSSGLRIDWNGDHSDPWVLITLVDEEIKVLLKKGAMPGWSNNVKLDGPLAQILTD